LISKDLINTTLEQCQNNVKVYLQKVNRLLLSLEARSIKLPTKFIAALILNNLSSEFDYLVTAISQSFRSNDDIDLESMCSQIIDESRRLSGIKKSPSSSNQKSLQSSTPKSDDIEMSLTTKNSKGLSRSDRSRSSSSSRRQCSYCHKTGHNTENCWQKYPAKRPKQTNNTQEEALTTIVSVDQQIADTNITRTTTEWVLDSGASSHICLEQSLFHNLSPVSNIYIR